MTSPICTKVLDGKTKVYEPLIVDCPPVNERVIVEYSFRVPSGGPDDRPGRTRMQRSTAVSSTEGGAEGITLETFGIFWEGDCSDDWYWSDTPDDADPRNEGRVNNPLCRPFYNSPDKLCDGGTHHNKRGAIYHNVLGVWNAGGCQGQLVFEASQGRNSPFGDFGPGECLQPLTQVCQGTPISRSTSMPTAPVVPSSAPTGSATIAAATDDSTNIPTITAAANPTDIPTSFRTYPPSNIPTNSIPTSLPLAVGRGSASSAVTSSVSTSVAPVVFLFAFCAAFL